jgi:hypothetical protein
MMKQPNKWDTAGYCIDTIYENMFSAFLSGYPKHEDSDTKCVDVSTTANDSMDLYHTKSKQP